LTVALTLIWLMMIALFRSSSAAMVALIPNALSILLFFGILGWAGIPLDINTSLVASVVLGLAVDNAVHLMWRYREQRQRGIEPGIALHQALRHAGPPILIANLTLIAAFVIFGLSTFPPIRIEGLLAAMTVSASVLSNLFVLPALIAHPLFGLNLFRR
jgi:predicted RND superfamily exporter protein